MKFVNEFLDIIKQFVGIAIKHHRKGNHDNKNC